MIICNIENFTLQRNFSRMNQPKYEVFEYHFVRNLKILYENVENVHNFHCVRSYSCPK